ncbi:MAG: LacI family DNA-binding transcriptional regulator [Microbacteriaceae bacterium]
MIPQPSKPTLRDVAIKAGVSVSTVSAYINGNKLVSPPLQVRIRDSISELNFSPNMQARNLRTGRAASIGLLVPDLRNPYFAELAMGIEQRLHDDGVTLTLCQTGPLGGKEEHYSQLVNKAMVDGVIAITGTGTISPSLLELATNFPFVLADEDLPSLDVPFVGSDNRLGARAVAMEALRDGKHTVAILSGPQKLWSATERLAGYREAIAATGSIEKVVMNGDYTFESGYACAVEMFPANSAPQFDTVLAANDLMALGVLRRLRELAIPIPGTVTVVGFDDIPSAMMVTPTLTTVSQPSRQIGWQSADMLLRIINKVDLDSTRVILPTQVVIRESSGR